MNRKEDGLTIDVKKLGTQAWHVQLVKNEIPLTKGMLYRVSFRAQASISYSFSTYLGKASAPYNAYSGYQNLSAGPMEREYSYLFKMTDASDLVARFTLDLGTSISQFTLREVRVEELHYNVLGTSGSAVESTLVVSPNPATDSIKVEGTASFERLELLGSNGQVLQAHRLRGQESFLLNVSPLPAGLYLIRLESVDGSVTRKLLKQ